jgi:hypothetical protein
LRIWSLSMSGWLIWWETGMPDAHSAGSRHPYPVPTKPASGIQSWEGWPDDVRDIIRDWNRRCGLSFVRGRIFKCDDCGEFCEPAAHGDAVFRGTLRLCDDCVIARARAGYKPPQQWAAGKRLS